MYWGTHLGASLVASYLSGTMLENHGNKAKVFMYTAALPVCLMFVAPFVQESRIEEGENWRVQLVKLKAVLLGKPMPSTPKRAGVERTKDEHADILEEEARSRNEKQTKSL